MKELNELEAEELWDGYWNAMLRRGNFKGVEYRAEMTRRLTHYDSIMKAVPVDVREDVDHITKEVLPVIATFFKEEGTVSGSPKELAEGYNRLATAYLAMAAKVVE